MNFYKETKLILKFTHGIGIGKFANKNAKTANKNANIAKNANIIKNCEYRKKECDWDN